MGNIHDQEPKLGPEPTTSEGDSLSVDSWQRIIREMQAQGIDPTIPDAINSPLEIQSAQQAIQEDLGIIHPIRNYFRDKNPGDVISSFELNRNEYIVPDEQVEPTDLDSSRLFRTEPPTNIPFEQKYRPVDPFAPGMPDFFQDEAARQRAFAWPHLPSSYPTTLGEDNEPRDMHGRLLGEPFSWRDLPENPIHPLFNYDQGRWPTHEFPEAPVPEDAPRNPFVDEWEMHEAENARRRLQETLDPALTSSRDEGEVFQWTLTNPQPGKLLGETVHPQIPFTEQTLRDLLEVVQDDDMRLQILKALDKLSRSNSTYVELVGGSEDTTGLLPYELDSIRDSDPKSGIRRPDWINEYNKDKFRKDNTGKGDE